MIHAHIYNENINDGDHGPMYLKLQDKINKDAGTQITITCDVNKEIRVLQKHVWRCNRPCRKSY